jgi:hypothetical protein
LHWQVDKSLPLIDTDIQCGDLGDIKLKVGLDAKFTGTANLGVIASGTMVPPAFTSFTVTTSMSADLTGTATINAGITAGALDTGKIQLFTIGIPGLDIPE